MAAAVRVEKATSDLLLGPDWTLNIDICDDANSDHGQAKEVIKTLKKRLQHKNSSVQFLALTLLETLVKNCGDHVHFLVVERGILPEMVKVAKKKANVQVRDKILTLLDSWQEAFGGPGGKHPQFYWAYSELKQSGLEFPRRSPEAATIFAPHLQPGIGSPVNSSLRGDEMISSSGSPLSLSDLQRILSAAELLSEMLREVNPNDHEELGTGKKLGMGSLRDGLYYLDKEASPLVAAVLSPSPLEEFVLQHRRLGHMSFAILGQLYPNLYNKVKKENLVCDACQFGKQTRSSYVSSDNRSDTPLQVIHSDVWGPSRVSSLNGYRSFVTFIDCCTRVTWVYVLRTKDDVFECFVDFHNMIRTQYNACMKIFRTDNDTGPSSDRGNISSQYDDLDVPIAHRKQPRSKAGKLPSKLDPYNISNYVSYDTVGPSYKSFIVALDSTGPLPRDWQEAKSNPKWRAAMIEEMTALDKNNTWGMMMARSLG